MRIELRILCIALTSCLAMNTLAQQTPSSASLHGIVTDFFGLPLPEATVELFLEGSKSSFKSVTDQNGNYRIANLPAGSYNVVASLRGFKRETSHIDLQEKESRLLNVGLEVGRLSDVPLMEVTGVVQQNSKALSDAVVILTNAFNQRESYTAITDGRGRYKIRVNNAGQYLIHASKPGLTVGVTSVIITDWANLQHQVVNLSLSPLRLPRADGSYEK